MRSTRLERKNTSRKKKFFREGMGGLNLRKLSSVEETGTSTFDALE